MWTSALAHSLGARRAAQRTSSASSPSVKREAAGEATTGGDDGGGPGFREINAHFPFSPSVTPLPVLVFTTHPFPRRWPMAALPTPETTITDSS